MYRSQLGDVAVDLDFGKANVVLGIDRMKEAAGRLNNRSLSNAKWFVGEDMDVFKIAEMKSPV